MRNILSNQLSSPRHLQLEYYHRQFLSNRICLMQFWIFHQDDRKIIINNFFPQSIHHFFICNLTGGVTPDLVSDRMAMTQNWYKSVKPRIHSISPIPDTKYYVISIKTSIITQRMMKSYKAKQCTNVRVTVSSNTVRQWILHPSLILYVQNIQILWGLSSNSIVLRGAVRVLVVMEFESQNLRFRLDFFYL